MNLNVTDLLLGQIQISVIDSFIVSKSFLS
jgi:hypothetical protein